MVFTERAVISYGLEGGHHYSRIIPLALCLVVYKSACVRVCERYTRDSLVRSVNHYGKDALEVSYRHIVIAII